MTTHKHSWKWQGRNPVEGVNTELWKVCERCGEEQQLHIVKIEPHHKDKLFVTLRNFWQLTQSPSNYALLLISATK